MGIIIDFDELVSRQGAKHPANGEAGLDRHESATSNSSPALLTPGHTERIPL